MDWSVPIDDKIAIASCDVIGKLLPQMEDIPQHYKDNWRGGSPAEKWFHYTNRDWIFTPREGIDLDVALKQVGCILKSLDPSFEHKISGTWWLMDMFFTEINMNGKIYRSPER